MNNSNQEEAIARYQQFEQKTDELARQEAQAKVQIAIAAAKHQVAIKSAYYFQQLAQEEFPKAYGEMIEQSQKLVQDFADFATASTLDVEASTAGQLPELQMKTPKFTSFSKTISEKRTEESGLLRLEGVEVNSESDKLALESLGFAIHSDE